MQTVVNSEKYVLFFPKHAELITFELLPSGKLAVGGGCPHGKWDWRNVNTLNTNWHWDNDESKTKACSWVRIGNSCIYSNHQDEKYLCYITPMSSTDLVLRTPMPLMTLLVPTFPERTFTMAVDSNDRSVVEVEKTGAHGKWELINEEIVTTFHWNGVEKLAKEGTFSQISGTGVWFKTGNQKYKCFLALDT